MSQHAKSVIAALAAVIITGVQAWQVATVGGFHLVALLPVASSVTGALLVFVVPNVPELPWAKTVVHGAAAVLTALSTFVSSHSAGFTAVNLLTVGAGAFLVWFVPELAPLPAVTGQRDILAALADVPASPAAVQHLTQPIATGELPTTAGTAGPAFDSSLAELSAPAPTLI